MRLFSKSLAIGLPASRVDAYLRRPDSVRVYWTTLLWPPPRLGLYILHVRVDKIERQPVIMSMLMLLGYIRDTQY